MRVEPLARKDSSRLALPAKNFWNSAGSVILFMPTSMTVAPGLTKSRVMRPGATDGGDEDISAAADGGQIFGFGVGDG